MTNAFLKRVDILTDWHNRFPDANVDLLAELVLDVWNKAEEYTKEHTVNLLQEEVLENNDQYSPGETAGIYAAIDLIKVEDK